MLSAICFNLDQSKILSSGNESTNLSFLDCGKRRNLDCSKLKQFGDYNFKIHDNCLNFSKRVEKTYAADMQKGQVCLVMG